MHEDIRALWQETFGDSDAFLSHYFAKLHRDENMLVTTEDDSELVAMMTMFPIELVSGENAFPARYVYAVATAEPWRGLGISTSLMAYALEEMKEAGVAAAILVPAHFSLFDFYGRQGFSTAFFATENAVDAAELPAPEGTISELTAEALYVMRNRVFVNSRLFAKWDENTLEYIISSTRLYGGAVLEFHSQSSEGYAVATCENGICSVKELGLMGMGRSQALALLHSRVNAERYILHLIATGDPDPMPFGMIQWLDEAAEKRALQGSEAPYFGLVMD
jgi:predicted acetyltransferase